MMAGVDMVHAPYRGAGPALTDLIAGQVQVYFTTTVASIEYIRAGRLRALAVTTATRSDALPGIPTVDEFVPGYEASFWLGVGAPKATPAEIVDKLNKPAFTGSRTEFRRGLRDSDIAISILAWGEGAELEQPKRQSESVRYSIQLTAWDPFERPVLHAGACRGKGAISTLSSLTIFIGVK